MHAQPEDRPEGMPPNSRMHLAPWAALIVLALVTGFATWYLSADAPVLVGISGSKPQLETQSTPAPQAEETVAAEPEPPPPVPQDEPQLPALPTLDASDPSVSQQLTENSAMATLLMPLIPNQTIRRFVVVVDNIAAGKVLRKQVVAKPIQGDFTVIKTTPERYQLDPASYSRYDLFGEAASAMDAKVVASIYRRYYPLLQEAYDELGYPDRSFHTIMIRAIDHLLDAPIVEGQISLVRPKVFYQFADPSLEALPATHRQLLRMGPKNGGQIKRALQGLREELLAQ